jgi:transcriptional regulator with XRE-family HTH domain
MLFIVLDVGRSAMRNVPIPPHPLLDYIIKEFNLKNSRELANALDVTEGLISKIRAGVRPPTAEFILKIYDKTDLSIEEIRELLKD